MSAALPPRKLCLPIEDRLALNEDASIDLAQEFFGEASCTMCAERESTSTVNDRKASKDVIVQLIRQGREIGDFLVSELLARAIFHLAGGAGK